MDHEDHPYKGQLARLMDEQEQSEQEREAREYRVRVLLAREIPFIRQNAGQEFYFQSEELGSRDLVLKKMGWKIIDLEKQQEDLAFYCFNLLTAEIKLPLNIFTNTVETHESTRKCLWMEMTLQTEGESKSPQGAFRNTQVRVYRFCEERLLPLFRQFITERITWRVISRADYSEDRVIEQFKREVVQKVNEMIRQDFKHE